VRHERETMYKLQTRVTKRVVRVARRSVVAVRDGVQARGSIIGLDMAGLGVTGLGKTSGAVMRGSVMRGSVARGSVARASVTTTRPPPPSLEPMNIDDTTDEQPPPAHDPSSRRAILVIELGCAALSLCLQLIGSAVQLIGSAVSSAFLAICLGKAKRAPKPIEGLPWLEPSPGTCHATSTRLAPPSRAAPAHAKPLPW
jgi:hypothetical protein